jgi:hypothetical protein
MDVYVGDFIGVQESELSPKNGEAFWMAKVGASKCGKEKSEILALWYWPTTPKSLQGG